MTSENCPLFAVGDAGGTGTMTVASNPAQTSTTFGASLPVTTGTMDDSFDTVSSSDNTQSMAGTKSGNTWSITMTTTYNDIGGVMGNCNVTYSQTLSGAISPLSCTSVTETLTVLSGGEAANCMTVVGSNTEGATCTAVFANATCSQ